MDECNSYINGGDVHLKPFPGCRATQLEHHTIPILQEKQYDPAEIYVGAKRIVNLTTKSTDAQKVRMHKSTDAQKVRMHKKYGCTKSTDAQKYGCNL